MKLFRRIGNGITYSFTDGKSIGSGSLKLNTLKVGLILIGVAMAFTPIIYINYLANKTARYNAVSVEATDSNQATISNNNQTLEENNQATDNQNGSSVTVNGHKILVPDNGNVNTTVPTDDNQDIDVSINNSQDAASQAGTDENNSVQFELNSNISSSNGQNQRSTSRIRIRQ